MRTTLKMSCRLLLAAAASFLFGAAAHAEINVVTEHSTSVPPFRFESVPPPARNDAAAGAQFVIVDGDRDRNGGQLDVLHDDRIPTDEDQPAANFFFRAGTEGGRVRIDLGRIIPVKQVNTYSWHIGTRGPQVFTLYAADGAAAGFESEPRGGIDPESCGWKRVADVDTRPEEGDGGGQHGVSISHADGVIGKYRYLLFDIRRTQDRDPFGNTFYSEIDVLDADASAPAAIPLEHEPVVSTFHADDGKYHFTIEATAAPDLMDWAENELKPVVQEWYPKIVAMLPSEEFQAPTNVTLRFRNDMGGTPASAGGGRVNMNSGWFRRELNREARGAVVHELVHIVQNYGRARFRNPEATRTPGWLVEGIPDYIRWFLYEPQTRGAEITERNFDRANYDASYRISANFLDWVTREYDEDIVLKLNVAAREGRYAEPLWKDYTGKTVQELGDEWKQAHAKRLQIGTAKLESEDETGR